MKGIRITTASIVALVIASAVALTGCSSNDDFSYERPEPRPSELAVNNDTGKITKYTEYLWHYDDDDKLVWEEDVVFNDGFSEDDTIIVEGPFANQNQMYYDTYTELSSTVDVDGVPYPVTTTLNRDIFGLPSAEAAVYYNEHLATTKAIVDGTLKSYGLDQLVWDDIYNKISMAVMAEGVLPAPQYQITGRSVTTADERVVAGWNNGDPAWYTQQQITGNSTSSSEDYGYSFLCSTADITLVNADAILAAASAAVDADLADMVAFSITSSASKLLVETDQPCEIRAFLDKKDWNQAPPAPEGINPPGNYNNGDVVNPWS